MHDELDRVARAKRKAEEDDREKRLQDLKSKMAAEEKRIRALHSQNQGKNAEYDRLRLQRDGEQQRLINDRAQWDRVIADRVS